MRLIVIKYHMGRAVGILLVCGFGFFLGRYTYSPKVEIREVEVTSNCPELAPVSSCTPCLNMVQTCTENYRKVYELIQHDVKLREKLQENLSDALRDSAFWEQKYKDFSCE